MIQLQNQPFILLIHNTIIYLFSLQLKTAHMMTCIWIQTYTYKHMQKYFYLYIHRNIHRKIQNSDLFLQCIPCKFMLFFPNKGGKKGSNHPFTQLWYLSAFFFSQRTKHLILSYRQGKAACPGSKMEFWYKVYFSLVYSTQTKQTTPKPTTPTNFRGFLSSPHSWQILNAIGRNGVLFQEVQEEDH